MSALSRLLAGLFSVLFVIGVSHVPASAAEAVRAGAIHTEASAAAPCHACNGYRYQRPGTKAVYLVIDGYLHHVPDDATYFNLWAGWNGIRPYYGGIPIGDPLVSGTFLAQEPSGRTYLVGRTKRWIPNPTIFNQYAFDWSRVVKRNPEQLPAPWHDIPGR